MNDLHMDHTDTGSYSREIQADMAEGIPLVDQLAARIREKILEGIYMSGAHLSETALCLDFGVSRNTLREVFRMLTKEGLLRHESNRGVFVITPDLPAIIDVFAMRRIIECGAILQACPYHAGVRKMRDAVEQAEHWYNAGDWIKVGTANIAFHTAIVSLVGSSRLSRYFAQLMVELRLIFGLIDDPQYLHAPYTHMNRHILELLEQDEKKQAADALNQYLLCAERMITAAYAQRTCE